MLGQFSDIEGEMEPGLFDIEFSFLQSLWTMYLQNGEVTALGVLTVADNRTLLWYSS